MKKKKYLKYLAILAIVLLNFNIAKAQVSGDYRSVATGDWTDLNTWERFDGVTWSTPTIIVGFPGELVGTNEVTIQSGTDVMLTGLGLTTQPMGKLTIAGGGQLSILGSNNLPIFNLNTPEIFVESNPVSGLMYFEPQSILVLPEDAIIILGPDGLFAKPCNNNIEIWIGSQQIAACKGAPGDIFTFGELLQNGGTLNAIPTSNSPVCEDGTINLYGEYSGAFGTTTPNGSIAGVTYSWEITPPVGGLITSTSQDVTITNAVVGIYEAKLTCITYNLAAEYTNSETINVIVEPLPIPIISGKNPVSTFETGVTYTTDPGMSNYIWLVTGGTVTAGGTPNDNFITVSWGALGSGSVQLNYTNPTGCAALAPTIYTISIVTKQSDADASWNIPTTWFPSGVPTSLQDIIVNDSVVIDNTPLAICNNMTIDPGGTVHIGPQNALTVNGTLTNNVGSTGLVIRSDASGTGSLIHHSDGVEGMVQQYTSQDAWHYVSSSVNNALSEVYLGIYLKPFDEPSDDWGEYIVPTNIPLNVMQGYSAWSASTPSTVQFEGILNNGNQIKNVTCRDYDPILEDGGWNLVGNPYPSAIDWDAAGWTKDNVDNTIYFWKGNPGTGSGNYHYYIGAGGELPPIGINDGTNEIPAMQGFFVHAIDDGAPGVVNGTLGVSNNVRIHSNQSYYKEGFVNELPLIHLRASDMGDLTDETMIRFYAQSTIEFDNQFDALKLEGYLYPQLYTTTPKKSELAINTLPDFEQGTVIPLSFVSPKEGNYTIELSSFENFYPGTALYLEDLQTNSFQNLSKLQSYSFSSSPFDESLRFMLHFSVDDTSTEFKNNQLANIYTYEHNLYLKLPTGVGQADLSIFNLLGQLLMYKEISQSEMIRIPLNFNSGYHIVKVRWDRDFVTEKIYIK